MKKNPTALSLPSQGTLSEMYESLPEDQKKDILYTILELVLCGLPYRPTKAHFYSRQAMTTAGPLKIILSTTEEGVPLPYGADRVVLFSAVHLAMIQGRTDVQFKTLSEFMKKFGISDAGANYTRFRASMERLAACNMLIRYEHKDEGINRQHVPPIPFSSLPTSKAMRRGAEQQILLPGMRYMIQVSEPIFRCAQEHQIPLSIKLLSHFTNNPSGWDLATFLSWRSKLCKESGKEAYISETDLLAMIGSGDKRKRQVALTIKKRIREIQSVWPELRAELLTGNTLRIRPPVHGVLPVPEKADK
jgi:hypothetical protein